MLDDDGRARDQLAQWGWSPERIAHELPELVIEPKPGEKLTVDESAWHEVFSWVHNDLNHYGRDRQEYTVAADDARTSLGLEKGWGPGKTRMYWDRAIDLNITTNRGRVELASLVGCSVGMLRSVWRVHGPLTSHAGMDQPGWKQRFLAAPNELHDREDLQLGQVETDVWTWIQRQRLAMRLMTSAADDDRVTRDFADGDHGAWEGELWGEYWDWAAHYGLSSQEGKYQLGRFVVGAFRLMESSTRLFGLPQRGVPDLVST